MNIEWDADKARRNQVKHGVSFAEASTVFGDPLALTIPDPLHSREENRFVTLGVTVNFRMIVMVHTDRQDRIRIISAREATALERRKYEEGIRS